MNIEGQAHIALRLRGITPAAPNIGSDMPEWYKGALCAQADADMFFPDKGESTRAAKKICAGCDFKTECLEFALANNERFGVWGGLSERERRKFERTPQNRRAACGTSSGYRSHYRRGETPCGACRGADATARALRSA